MTDDATVDAAVDAIAEACRAVVRAEDVLKAAITHRRDTVARLWPTIYRFGPRWLAAEVGEGIITESNLRNLASDLSPRPSRGPFVGAPPTTDEAKAIGELAEACRAVQDARNGHRRALNRRPDVIREQWPVVAHIGAARLERLIGREFVGESTIRSAVAELVRQRGE